MIHRLHTHKHSLEIPPPVPPPRKICDVRGVCRSANQPPTRARIRWGHHASTPFYIVAIRDSSLIIDADARGIGNAPTTTIGVFSWGGVEVGACAWWR